MNSNIESMREDFARDGFVLVPQLFRAEECEELKSEALRILQGGDEAATVMVGAAAASPKFRALSDDERVVNILRALMPEGVAFLSDKIVFKSGEQTFATPWHCDAAYWPNTRPKISAWIALDAAGENNGALKVVPRSHLQSWNHDGDGAPNNEFAASVTPTWNAQDEIVCSLPQGGAIFFSDRLLHASCENPARADRYSIISTYHAPADDEPFDLHFPARHVVA